VLVTDLVDLLPGAGAFQARQRHVQLVHGRARRAQPHPAVLHLEAHPVPGLDAQHPPDLRRDGDLALGADATLQFVSAHCCTSLLTFSISTPFVPLLKIILNKELALGPRGAWACLTAVPKPASDGGVRPWLARKRGHTGRS